MTTRITCIDNMYILYIYSVNSSSYNVCSQDDPVVSPAAPESLFSLIYRTLLHRINISPRLPVQVPSTDTRKPLYSCPHFNLTMTGLPSRPFKKGLGFIIPIAPVVVAIVFLNTVPFLNRGYVFNSLL